LVGKTEGLRKARRRGDGATNQGERAQEVAKLSQVIQIEKGKIQEHLGEVVRSTVEERHPRPSNLNQKALDIRLKTGPTHASHSHADKASVVALRPLRGLSR